mgnify:CR=1 FL=1
MCRMLREFVASQKRLHAGVLSDFKGKRHGLTAEACSRRCANSSRTGPVVHPVRNWSWSGTFAGQGSGRRRADARQGRQRSHAEIPPEDGVDFWPDGSLGVSQSFPNGFHGTPERERLSERHKNSQSAAEKRTGRLRYERIKYFVCLSHRHVCFGRVGERRTAGHQRTNP